MSNYHCDWFQVTEPLNSPFTDFMKAAFAGWQIQPVHGHGYNGYRERNEWAGSVVEMWSDYDERMGRNWRFSGSSWEKIRQITGHDPNWRYWLRKWAMLGKGNITRIDLASDFHETDARTIASDILHGMNEGLIRKRSWKQIENSELGYTCYVGSRKSDIMLRCYDKGAQLDLEPFQIARTEFEIKKSKGQLIGTGMHDLMRLANDTESTIGGWLERVTMGMMLDFIPIHTLDRLGVSKWGCQPITLGSWLPKLLNNDSWYLNVVIPALIRRLNKADGKIDFAFWSAFVDELRKKMGMEAWEEYTQIDSQL